MRLTERREQQKSPKNGRIKHIAWKLHNAHVVQHHHPPPSISKDIEEQNERTTNYKKS